jgi:hypothetical protein
VGERLSLKQEQVHAKAVAVTSHIQCAMLVHHTVLVQQVADCQHLSTHPPLPGQMAPSLQAHDGCCLPGARRPPQSQAQPGGEASCGRNASALPLEACEVS